MTNSTKTNSSNCILAYIELIILPLLVYVYFVLGYLKIISLPVGLHSIVLMGIIFLASLIFAKHNAFLGREIFKKNRDKFDRNLEQYIVDNLVEIGANKKSNASFENFVENEHKNIRNDNYASIAAGVFPTMGILGTFISIAITMPDFASSSSSQLDKEISILLSGVGTAFYVSIYGILLSLWWIFFEKLGLSLYAKNINNIKQETKEYFWSKEGLEYAVMQENLAQFSQINSTLSTISNEKFLVKLSQAVEDKFAIFDKMLRLESEVIKVGSKQVKESTKELRDAQNAQQDLARIHDNIITTLEVLAKDIEKMHTKSMDNYVFIRESQKDVNDSVVDLRKSLSENVDKIASLYSVLPSDLQTTQNQVLNGFTKTLDESLARFWHEGVKAIQSKYEKSLDMDSFKQELKDIEEQSEELLKNVENLKQSK